ncbi:MAG TPA: isocitrate/isopropylmalate dehydrogenase family protein [Thermoplasmata archaeon]|nr:isocitrate/isopropylmalate dehydrogenase family protein [Thermoplasmata archaeon]
MKAKYRIVLLPGDGIGKEVTAEARRVLETAQTTHGLNLEFEELPCGGEYFLRTGREWPEGSFERCKESDAVLLGAVGWPGAMRPDGNIAGYECVLGLRFGLDLYANVRPTKLYPNVRHKIHDEFQQVWKPEKVDFVIVRENTEGFYTPARGMLSRGGVEEVAIDTRVITRKGSERVIRYAYELANGRQGAKKDGKHRVTCIDKSNVLRGCQFFRAIFDEIGKHDYPKIERDYAYIDAFTQWVLRQPEFYDVGVSTNAFGDIATDLSSVLGGSLGMAAGGNIGDHHAMFEPIHGSAPKHAGKDECNPMGAILAAAMMLDWLGKKHGDERMRKAGVAVEGAVEAVLRDGKSLTYDLGGSARCSLVGKEIARAVDARSG